MILLCMLTFYNFFLSQYYKEDWWRKLINFPFGFQTYFLNTICSVDRIIFFALKGYNKNCVYCYALHEVVWLMWANRSVSWKNWTFALHCKLAVTSILYSKVPLYDYQYFYLWRDFGFQVTEQQHWTYKILEKCQVFMLISWPVWIVCWKVHSVYLKCRLSL